MPTLFLVASLAAAAAVVAAPAPSATAGSGLEGRWTVDLRPKPDAPAYLKPMALSVAADGGLAGEFYEHAIEGGRAVSTSGRPCFAFRTSDASGPYQTSGCLVGDHVEGQTWSEGRRFLLTWTARR